MIKISFIDIIPVIVSILFTIIIIYRWRKSSFKLLTLAIGIYFILFIVFEGLMFIEWSGSEHDYELFENLAGAILPILWIIIFYMLIGKVNLKKLKKSEERLKLVIQSANLGIWDWSVKTGHLILNEQWPEMLGYRIDEIIPSFSTWESLVHPDDLQQTLDLLNAHMTNKIPHYEAEFRMIHKDGSWRWISARGKIVERDQLGNPVRATGIHQDITDEKLMKFKLEQSNEEYFILNQELSKSLEKIHQINSQLEEAMEKAEEGDRLKTAFLSNLSHEIRTPMNGILGFVDLIKDPNLKIEKRDTYIQIIENSGKRLLNMINDLIDISKIEEGQIDIYLQNTSVKSLILDLYLFFKPAAEEKGLKLIHKNDIMLDDSIIQMDSYRIQQVLSNLIDNAIKFTKSGKIVFGYSLKETVIEFYVTDTGIGIPPNLKEVIFERFRQVDVNSLSRDYEGSGLGLSISKAIVELHEGKIWLDSTPGKGSTFYFTLPLKTRKTRH